MAEAKETQAHEEEAVTTPPRETAFISFLKGEGERIELLLRTLHRLGHTPKRIRLVYEQMFLSGIQTLHVVILVGLVIGMIVSLQTGIELSKLGQQDQIGTIVAVSMAREMGPFITAIVLAASVGSAIAAELVFRGGAINDGVLCGPCAIDKGVEVGAVPSIAVAVFEGEGVAITA